jgi:hypothetical protein
VDRGVAAQAQFFGEISGLMRKRTVDADNEQLVVQRIEVRLCLGVRAGRQAPAALRGRESCAALWIGQDARRSVQRRRPQRGR